jgi:hypothetical protein
MGDFHLIEASKVRIKKTAQRLVINGHGLADSTDTNGVHTTQKPLLKLGWRKSGKHPPESITCGNPVG